MTFSAAAAFARLMRVYNAQEFTRAPPARQRPHHAAGSAAQQEVGANVLTYVPPGRFSATDKRLKIVVQMRMKTLKMKTRTKQTSCETMPRRRRSWPRRVGPVVAAAFCCSVASGILPSESALAQDAPTQNDPAPGGVDDPAPGAAPGLPPGMALTAPDTVNMPGVGVRDSRREETRMRRLQNQARLEREMRQVMAWLGCNERAVQDAILGHIGMEARARQTLRVQGRKLFEALRAERPLSLPPGVVPDAPIIALLADLRAGLQADRVRREASERMLDEKINYSKNPRLEAALLLLGVIGDGPELLILRPRQALPQMPPMPRIQMRERRPFRDKEAEPTTGEDGAVDEALRPPKPPPDAAPQGPPQDPTPPPPPTPRDP